MGQSFCKDCEGKFKRPAFVAASNEDGGTSSYSCEDTSDTVGSLRSSPSNGADLDPRRHSRIKNKKSSVALHAEFRDRQERGILIAPPLVTEKVMEYTDNVFSGQDLGVDKIVDDSDSGGGGGGGDGDGEGGVGGPRDEGGDGVCDSGHTDIHPVEDDDDVVDGRRRATSFARTPEEDAFLDLALSDDDNFVFDGMSVRFREKLKDSMERVVVPRNTLLIRKGDDPDYLYLILEGEVAVYIDPDEYVDDNAVEDGKHAPLDITVPSNSSSNSNGFGGGGGGGGNSARDHHNNEAAKVREFKQSYVLQLRRSLFQSSNVHNNSNSRGGDGNNYHRNNDLSIVGQFLSVIRQSMGGHDSNTSNLTGILEEQGSSEGSDDFDPADSFIPLKELRGLKHERDLGPCDVFGELGE